MKVEVRKAKKKDQHAIWQPEEFKAASGVVVKEQGDDREMPEYEILHQQKVGTTDAYLNLMESDPSSDQCMDLLVKIWLPDTQLKDISLDVLEDRCIPESHGERPIERPMQ